MAHTVYYCSEDDVAEFLQVDVFSGSTTPTDETVKDFISMAEERVDQLTNTAWHSGKPTTVTNERARIQAVDTGVVNVRGRIQLSHYPILDLTNGTDALNVWDGAGYTEYLANKTGTNTVTDPVNKDWWVDVERGIIYIDGYNIFNLQSSAPSDVAAYVTYRYGNRTTTVPQDIKLATIYFTASNIAMNDDLNLMQEGDDSMDNASRSQRYEDMAMKILKDNRRLGRDLVMSRAIGGFGIGRSTI